MESSVIRQGRRRMRVLIIEDQPVSSRMLSTMLSRSGFETVEAARADDGIRLARTKHPDLILLDIGLPDMSGLTVATILKADANTRNIPIIVVSAFATEAHQHRALKAGCAAYIVKPVDRLRLLATLQSFLPRPPDPDADLYRRRE
jgi:two-component system, cell cycle response regulator DivK